MCESPRSLLKICIDFICNNVLDLCEVHLGDTGEHSPNLLDTTTCNQQVNFSINSNNIDILGETIARASNDGSSGSARRLSFRYPDVFLPAEISEQLLSNLCEKKTLSDLTITLFDSKSTRLRHVQLKDASTLSAKGLKVLKQHKVVDLVVNGLKITVNDLISCLGDWSLQNLRSLSVAKGSFMDCSRYCVVVTLSKLRALHTLNVSETEFNKHGLEIVVEDLPLLESLDISCTKVDDITPLKKCKNRLKTLNMYNLKINESANLISVLLELNELRNLDISDERDMHALNSVLGPAKPKITDFLKAVHCMPYLTSLDLSGKGDIDPKDLKEFIKAHPYLRFLGLVSTDACFDDSLINPSNEDYRPGLVVSGTATESQILEALRRYTCRPFYLEKCLFNLFRLTHNFLEPRVDVIKLILPGMREYPQEVRVQVPCTACLYNLTKGEFAIMIHPSILKQVVELTMIAMESYPTNYRLQMNTLLTLCSDRILQDVAFDKYRCARLVLNSLLTFNEPSMNRMSVAICSLLAAKISTVETSLLGAEPLYMSKLLQMVKSKMESKSVDITMKFTLSALWNLTDESVTTCEVFLDEGGMELCLKMLESFQDESSVETKVLGLLNNIAEVVHLRPRLMQPKFISMLSVLLTSAHIDVSYFAAGIAAHLLSDGPRAWTTMITVPTRDGLLEQLAYTVTHWQTPQGEMVAYRSFHPFFPLLRCSDAYPVQLWAVWAIHNVCTKNPKRYCSMLIREGGVEILKYLESTHTEQTMKPNLQSLCQSILKTLELNS
ncbi:protein zyg-11 homolog B isoform X1 [Osmia lignaria lignaria]|uniref:protein zyg-11 homolog B isoform X1 n=1 Tax=Osmia lignaria lignaria TaxID=1437193 RepID=UPI001478F79E|nr:protein zyg-11 homolog B-like isoform X1 [Osmia lignaria]XP_034180629.1 protein zyg-11 homolog B-like isoform X1 [Osmia lignaria]XP_034180716.1 protein zyg-11 homolog B-like isoform X1 [Osmia lignaria]XP_034180802.1 protein zyg-11 homolog B-like isoform X1 [Osmia lignaria]XP_034180879.1 protein zyg-11 homolog B-like isoform X1 [Osmia lignaria]XP_034180963.1 protein zyg-11 homolog B-like isoform X1 [Osmia lignaria]XP_034181051.1 protein zyg-11 homolog B-like isoform X1 [Osmia lignaria]